MEKAFNVSKISFGTSIFNGWHNPVEKHWPLEAVTRALDLGINEFDTSPYYGRSEEILGTILNSLRTRYPRSSYYLSTKVGRYGPNKEDFDYSSKRVRESVEESCRRLNTNYFDVVYCHDVEFVSLEDVVGEGGALKELFRLKQEGKIKYVGISGYPLDVLIRISQIQYDRGQPVDVVLSYSHYCLHNTCLSSCINIFHSLGVIYVMNASPLSMGLLREAPAPDWHPAPPELREAASKCAMLAQKEGLKLSHLAIQFALEYEEVKSTIIGFSNAKEVEEGIECLSRMSRRKINEKAGVIEGEDEKYKKEQIVINMIRKYMKSWDKWSWRSPPE
ncbi:13645_t:CDS:2 [Acaulospora morrowiae]|uniref:13645_t:CDS:1 n=1 Tax=Acaulospora morrowiae TaxID=94023 RepID=A0A9N9A761_9GLOM|nr:13645_t:CDS:2 [Acaulospora morrowiae]